MGEFQKTTSTKDPEIRALKAQLDAIERPKKLAITEEVSIIEKELD